MVYPERWPELSLQEIIEAAKTAQQAQSRSQEKKRWYNGPHSELMDKIYDRLMEHVDITEFDDWAIISLYLAREIKRIGKEGI